MVDADAGGVDRVTFLGFVVAVAILATLVLLVGVGDVLAALGRADPSVLVVILLATGVWVGVWSFTLRVTLRALAIPASPATTSMVYVNMMFWDNVTPFSTLGADPVAAAVLSRATGTAYERALAAVMVVDFLNFLPAPVLALVGIASLVTPGADGRFLKLVVPLVVVLLGLTVGLALAWAHRHRARGTAERVARGVRPLARRFGIAAGEPALEERFGVLVERLEELADDHRTLGLAIVFATAGWGLLSALLWLSLAAVGLAIPPGVVVALVPLVTVLEVLPLPGGVGGLETALVVFIVAVTEAGPATTTAGVLVFRAASFWLPTAVGGLLTPVLLRSGD